MADEQQAVPPGRSPRRAWIGWGTDRSLILLIAGALVLIIAGLIVVPLVARQTPALAPPTTPEGAVQRFYQALYKGDYETAHSLLSADTLGKVSVAELQQEMSTELRDTQIRTGKVTVNGSTATVQVTVTHFGSGGLFGSNEWTSQNEVLLQLEGGTWKIVSGFGYFPKLTDGTAP